jgi:hypothetical protein
MGVGKAEQPLAWPLPGARRPSRPSGQGAPQPRRTVWAWLWLAARVLVVLIALLAAGTGILLWRLGATVTDYPGAHFNSGQNGIWLEHEWAGEPHTTAEYDALAARLRAEQIRYVYAHVGPLNSDGTIPADRAPNAGELATALHSRLPGIHVLAWIGQVERAGGLPPDESVDLGDSTVRREIAHTAAHFTTDLGFDGIHYDIEPIVNNNPRFLDLLVETRAVLPAGSLLSITAQKWAPSARLADFLRSQGKAGAWWTSYYYAKVAEYCDQIVSIIYDTAMPTAGLYQLFVQQETQHILEAVRSAHHPPQVLIGVPTYSGNSFWFHETAENMKTSLTGVIAGLNSNRDTSHFTGVAIYRLATTSPTSWLTYQRLWLGQ